MENDEHFRKAFKLRMRLMINCYRVSLLLREEPPTKVFTDRVQRNILSEKPRVTKFPINFHPENNENEEQPPPSEQWPETGEDPLTLANHDPPNEEDK
ncbi:hypothetical protein TSUD_390280 [Trifolium subterraneum]|uniref:Uncharacterized protein n=1 Tax=Trifolium subterraneum TaxID=3900 RepID=A0A2Z6PEI6_TRISU|nr:hypothetical protein TSUD_390280 [Trifolium subterraneum]